MPLPQKHKQIDFFGGANSFTMTENKDQLEHIRWRAITNPHALEEI